VRHVPERTLTCVDPNVISEAAKQQQTLAQQQPRSVELVDHGAQPRRRELSRALGQLPKSVALAWWTHHHADRALRIGEGRPDAGVALVAGTGEGLLVFAA
jgi:hypothetical protein